MVVTIPLVKFDLEISAKLRRRQLKDALRGPKSARHYRKGHHHYMVIDVLDQKHGVYMTPIFTNGQEFFRQRTDMTLAPLDVPGLTIMDGDDNEIITFFLVMGKITFEDKIIEWSPGHGLEVTIDANRSVSNYEIVSYQ